MFDWLSTLFTSNASSSEPSTSESSSSGAEYFDNFGCGAPFQVSAESSYLSETRSHEFTTTTYGDSMSSDWSSSSSTSSFSSWD